MHEIIVAIAYASIFLFLIYRKKYFSVKGIGNTWFSLAFIFKIFLGVGNYLIWLYIIGHGDSLNYFSDSKLIYNTLPEHPADFLQLTFGFRNAEYPEHLRYVSDHLFYSWNTPEYMMVRINAILNIFTFGSVYANIIILCFLYFFVHVLLLKTILKYYAGNPKILFLLFFFLPSLTFWCSGLLKEGPALLLLSLLFVELTKQDFSAVMSLKSIMRLAILLFCMFLIRDFLLLLMLLNLIIFYVALHYRTTAKRIFFFATLIFSAIIVSADILTSNFYIPHALQRMQSYFYASNSEPDYHFPVLPATYSGLLPFLPLAVNNILFRPNLLHSHDIFRIYQSVELIATWVFLCICILRSRKHLHLPPSFLFLVFVSLELLFMFGLVVVDADTLSRYRSIPVFFLCVTALCACNTSSMKTKSKVL